MLVSAIALTVVCVASSAIIPALWWMPRSGRKAAGSGLVRSFDRRKDGVTFKPQSGRSHRRAA